MQDIKLHRAPAPPLVSLFFTPPSAVSFLWICDAQRLLDKHIKNTRPRWQHESFAPDHSATEDLSCANKLALDEICQCLPPDHSLSSTLSSIHESLTTATLKKRRRKIIKKSRQ